MLLLLLIAISMNISQSNQVGQLLSWQTGPVWWGLVGQPVGQPIGWDVSWRVGQPVSHLVSQSVGQLAGQ